MVGGFIPLIKLHNVWVAYFVSQTHPVGHFRSACLINAVDCHKVDGPFPATLVNRRRLSLSDLIIKDEILHGPRACSKLFSTALAYMYTSFLLWHQ